MPFHGNVYPGQGSAARLGESGGSVCGPWSGMTQGRRNITEEGRGLRLARTSVPLLGLGSLGNDRG
jgi:hypothetical protein